jgi:uncharacterized coiled-coil protein SlyX
MIGVLHELEQRRMALQERSSAQRALIAESTAALAARGRVLDRAVAVARAIAARPLVIGSIVALAVVVGPRRILGWAARATAFYGLTRQFAATLRDQSR